MQLLQVACGEQMPERRCVRDTILPEQEHARNVLVKKGLRQGSDGGIAESILRKIKAVQPNVHAGVLRAQLAHDLGQAIANSRNVLGRREAPAGHINRDSCRPVATSNPHTLSVHGGRRQGAEWASRPKLESQVVTTACAGGTKVLTRSTSCVFNAPQLSHNSICQQSLGSCLMKALAGWLAISWLSLPFQKRPFQEQKLSQNRRFGARSLVSNFL